MSDKPANASAVSSLPLPVGEGRGEGADATGFASAPGSSAGPASLDQLVTDHQEKITRLVHRLLGWSSDVEDVVQDVFVDALKNLSKFNSRSSVITWLTRIAINRCRSHQRKQWLRRFFPLPQAEGAAPLAPGGRGAGGEGADQLSTEEIIQQVHAAIRQLNQKDRELIVLRYLEEQPIDDIAQTLGLTRGAVNVRLNRARSRLETILKPILET